MFDNLDDPKKQLLLMMGLGLLGGAPGQRKNFGADLAHGGLLGLQGYSQAKQGQARLAEEAQQREMREMQMAQMRRSQENEGKLGQAFQSAFGPNPNLVANDDQGLPMPQAPGGGGMPEFLKTVGGFDPRMALSMMPKPKGPLVLSRGARAFGEDGREIAANPEIEKPESKFAKVNPADYTPDSFRKFAASGNYAELVPYRKPDAPDKPARPQLYDGPEGPVWVTPPQPGQANSTLPVTDPEGKAISAKKRNTPLTEAQSRGTLFLGQMRAAEDAIKGLKFKPESMTGQAQLAAALKAKEAGTMSGAMMNIAAGKDAQQYAQAAEQWSEAFLRIKTGAASTRDEVLRNVRTFFPQPGDTPAVIRQKNSARATAIKQMEIIAGQGVQQLDAQSKGGGASGGWSIRPIGE